MSDLRFLPPTRFLLSLLVGVLLLSGCGSSGEDSSAVEDRPFKVERGLSDSTVALIISSEYGSDTLSTTHYWHQLQRREMTGRVNNQLVEAHRSVIRGFVRRHVLEGEAELRNIEIDSAKSTARLGQIIKDRYRSEKQFRKVLAQNNMTVGSARSAVTDRIRRQTVLQQIAQSYEEPSAKEVEAYSWKNRRIRAQQILLRAGQDAPEAEVDAARQAAQALVDSAQMANVNFADLARRHSEGPSAHRGGDLGFFSRNQMAEDFSDAAYALSDSGDVAPEPVRTQYGFHVIRLTDPGEPMDTTKARKQMKKERRSTAITREMNELMSSVTVHTHPFAELKRIGKAIQAREDSIRRAREAEKRRESRRKQKIRRTYVGVYEDPLGDKLYVRYGKWHSGDLSDPGLPWEVKSAEAVNLCSDVRCLTKIRLRLTDQSRKIGGNTYNFTLNGVPHRKIR